MKNKLMIAVQEKYKRSNSKTNLKSKNNQSNTINEPHEEQKGITFTSPKVNDLMDSFKKQISDPISLYTELHNAKAPQKCLQHNNISTLYCLKDERLLCAGCMYQTPIHKGHKVIPLTQASDNMKNDIKNKTNLIEEHLKNSKKEIQKTVKNLEKAEKEYPQLMEQVHNFFMDLHQLLIDRKNQHLQLLNETWSKLRYQNYMMRSQLTRICDYAEKKLREVISGNIDADTSFNKNIVDHLSRIGDIIHQDLVQIEENHYLKEIKKFKKVTEFVSNNLVLMEIKNKIIQSLYLADYNIKKSNSRSSIKRTSSTILKSPRSVTPKKAQKTAQQKLIEMHFGEQKQQQKKSPKNRHSINQVQLLKELTDRRKAFQNDMQKKNKLTPAKSHKSIKKSVESPPKSPAKQKSAKTKKI